MRRHFITFALLGAIAMLSCAHSVLADVITLKDGTRIEGQVKRTEAGWTVMSADGKATDVAADDVKTIEVGGGKTSDATAASNLASLRRSVEALNSPATVLERYRRFLDQNKGTASVDDAKKDMAIWQDRLDRGLVKVGSEWVTREQQSEMASQASSIAKQAVDLLSQGRTNEAEPVVQQALDADPRNPAAMYLHGLILFGQQQTVAARKAFEAVLVAQAGHGPSFNNLGVILWRQNQQMGALRFYEQAMLSMPVNKVVLDNVAEALAALPDDQRKNPLAVRVYKLFSAQDAQLQIIEAQSGLHRWGSTWVDQATLDMLKAKEQAVKDQLDKIAAAVDAEKAKIADDDSSIEANNRSMTQMQTDSMTRDLKGNYYQAPLPQTYYTMQADNEKLTADRATHQAKIQSLGQDARKARQSIPVPQFTGVQRMMGPEGAPFPPTTAPSTAPTGAQSPGPATEPAPMSAPVMMPLP
jgi:tetratricopeptide (TPR) repeat protein